MTLSTLYWEIGAFFFYILYGSYFEWIFHRYMFHSPKLVYRTFHAHTMVHHQVYKSDDSYHTHDHPPQKVGMDWWAMFAMVGFNLPIFWLIQKVTGIPSMWGGAVMVALYYTVYETFHWSMHVPRASKFLSRFRYYRYLDAHHRMHHKYMLSNLNVIIPLADLTLGTLRDAQGKRILLFGSAKNKKAKAVAAQETPAAQQPSAARRPNALPIVKKTTSAVE